MIYVVLPPELSKRSIQILIQYMYSGEATVSNDILNEVLRGGEVLKIRGLWRNNQTSEPNASSTPQYMPTKLDTGGTKDNSVYGEKLIYEHRTERLSNSGNLSMSTIKESPVIVMSPTHLTSPEKALSSSTSQQQSQHQQQQQQQSQHLHQSVALHHHHSTQSLHQSSQSQVPPSHTQAPVAPQNLLSKKDITIDPNENTAIGSCASDLSSSAHYNLVSHSVPGPMKKAQQLPDRRLKPLNENGSETLASHHNQVQYQQQHSDRHYSEERLQLKDLIDASLAACQPHLRDNEILRISEKRRTSLTESQQLQQQQRPAHHYEAGIEKPLKLTAKILEKKTNEALNFLAIKQEPVEWTDFEQENGIEKSHIEVTVKPEFVYGEEESNGKFCLVLF